MADRLVTINCALDYTRHHACSRSGHALTLTGFASCTVTAQTAAAPRYEIRVTHDPDGTGTGLYERMQREGRIVTDNWDLYDTRHVVFRPTRLQPEVLKEGYEWAYREFYKWAAISRASLHHGSLKHQAKHFFYASGWKKFEPLWDLFIRARQLAHITPQLDGVLARVSRSQRAAFPQTVAEAEAVPSPLLQILAAQTSVPDPLD